MQVLRFVLLRLRTAMAASHQTPNRFRKLWKFSEDAYCPQPLFVVEGGRAAYHGARRDVPVGAALGGHNDAIADMAVSRDPGLTGEDDVLAHDRRSGETDLCA